LKREPGKSRVFGGEVFLMQPVVHVVDSGGNLVNSDSSSVIAVSIFSNPASGELSPKENLIAPVQSGIARFSRLMINKAGKDYRLVYYHLSNDGETQGTGISIIGRPQIGASLLVSSRRKSI
jgi:hypothetical protein